MAGRLNRHVGRQFGHLPEVKRAEREEDQKDAEHKAEIADPVDDERLLACIGRALLGVVEADQEIGAEPDSLPPDEHHQEVAAQDQDQHEEAEQVQVAKIPGESGAGLLMHVRRRVDVNEETDAGDDENHHPRKRIERELPRHLEDAVPIDGVEGNRRNPRREFDRVEPIVFR